MSRTKRSFIVFLVMLLFSFNKSQTCSLSYQLEACISVCSLEDAISAALSSNDCSEDSIIDLSVSASVISGPGNGNITLQGPSRIQKLHLNIDRVLLNKGFFIHTNDSLINLAISGYQNSSMIISGGGETSVSFKSNSVAATTSISAIFEDCTAIETAGLLVDSNGKLDLEISFLRTSATNCGALSMILYESTQLSSYEIICENTRAEENGGCACLTSGDNSSFEIPMIEVRGTEAKKGSIYYTKGNFLMTDISFYPSYAIAQEGGYILYGELFDSITINELYMGVGNIPEMTRSAYYLQGNENNNNSSVHITNSTFNSMGQQTDGNGAHFYFENVQSVNIAHSSFVAAYSPYGMGSLVFDGVENITLHNLFFDGNTASRGASISCVNGNVETKATDINFQRSRSTSLDLETLDVFSDESCSPFWLSQTPCERLRCDSCPGSVCGQEAMNGDLYCFCYCDSDHLCEPIPSPSAFRSATPYPSVTASISESTRIQTQSTETSSFFLALWITVIVIVFIVILIMVAVAAGAYWYKKKKSYAEYDTVASRPPTTPQRETEFYQE